MKILLNNITIPIFTFNQTGIHFHRYVSLKLYLHKWIFIHLYSESKRLLKLQVQT